MAIVGAGIRGCRVMARWFKTHKAQVPLFQTADSHTNIACLVKKEDMIKALRALHEEFGLDDLKEDRGTKIAMENKFPEEREVN